MIFERLSLVATHNEKLVYQNFNFLSSTRPNELFFEFSDLGVRVTFLDSPICEISFA